MLILLTGVPPIQDTTTRRAKTLRWFASLLASYGQSIIVVTPDHVSMKNGRIHRLHGWQWHEQTWQSTRMRADREWIWLDWMYLEDLLRYGSTYRRLRTALTAPKVRMLGESFPGKDVLYDEFQGAQVKPACIPKTWRVPSPEAALSLLRTHRRLWLKPVYGSGGRNVARLTLLANQHLQIKSDRWLNRTLDLEVGARSARAFFQRALARRPFLLQEEVAIPTTSDGHRMDVRVTLIRTPDGGWQRIATTLRKSAGQSIVTNRHAGGSTCSMTHSDASNWLVDANLTSVDMLRAERAAQQVSKVLAQHHPRVAMVGIDVAPGYPCCTVYDFNSRPGRDLLTDEELQAMLQALAAYAAAVAQSGRNPVP